MESNRQHHILDGALNRVADCLYATNDSSRAQMQRASRVCEDFLRESGEDVTTDNVERLLGSMDVLNLMKRAEENESLSRDLTRMSKEVVDNMATSSSPIVSSKAKHIQQMRSYWQDLVSGVTAEELSEFDAGKHEILISRIKNYDLSTWRWLSPTALEQEAAAILAHCNTHAFMHWRFFADDTDEEIRRMKIMFAWELLAHKTYFRPYVLCSDEPWSCSDDIDRTIMEAAFTAVCMYAHSEATRSSGTAHPELTYTRGFTNNLLWLASQLNSNSEQRDHHRPHYVSVSIALRRSADDLSCLFSTNKNSASTEDPVEVTLCVKKIRDVLKRAYLTYLTPSPREEDRKIYDNDDKCATFSSVMQLWRESAEVFLKHAVLRLEQWAYVPFTDKVGNDFCTPRCKLFMPNVRLLLEAERVVRVENENAFWKDIADKLIESYPLERDRRPETIALDSSTERFVKKYKDSLTRTFMPMLVEAFKKCVMARPRLDSAAQVLALRLLGDGYVALEEGRQGGRIPQPQLFGYDYLTPFSPDVRRYLTSYVDEVIDATSKDQRRSQVETLEREGTHLVGASEGGGKRKRCFFENQFEWNFSSYSCATQWRLALEEEKEG